MRIWSVVLSVVVLGLTMVPLTSAQEEDAVDRSDYVVMPHMKGSLALQVSSVSGLWFQPAGDGTPAKLRVLSPALTEAKTLAGADAQAIWASFQAREGEFLFVGHMGGTLAIPRAQVRTAYYSEDTGAPRLRLTYDGDPSGKTLDGDEATTVWNEIQR
jgi:hypothetical protein